MKCLLNPVKPGLFKKIAEDHLLRMDRTLYIGDDIRDCQAAYNAGCGSVLIANNLKSEPVENKPGWSVTFSRLSDAIPDIKLYMEGINK